MADELSDFFVATAGFRVNNTKIPSRFVANNAVTSIPVMAPDITADIVCASSITRAYIVNNVTGITISPSQKL